MKKEFNIAGTCYPALHYMMDNSAKLEKVMTLIEGGKYFTINRPRQYGKTTILHAINHVLLNSTEFLPIALNFQGIDDKWHQSDESFAQMFVRQLIKATQYHAPHLSDFLKNRLLSIEDMDSLSDTITELVYQETKKLVLLIDEVDASANYLPFLKFLGMLRNKYLDRVSRQNYTFHSIVLAGVHDIKSFKYKLRNPQEAHYNSPWNIAVEFEVDMSFHPQEIIPMLQSYCLAENVKMDVPQIAERLYYHTSGYPFLVSKLCKNIAEKILPEKDNPTQWSLNDVETSVRMLLKENNTNFDSLIKNLENHADLYDLVKRIIMEGETIPFNQYNPVIYQGVLYGIFKQNGQLKMHNRLYEQLVYDYMASRMLTNIRQYFNYGGHFVTEEKGLDMKAVLLKFQQFMKEEYSKQDKSFYERQGRVIFLAFLNPILNGYGYAFREVQASLEKRLDVVITYLQHRYIIELKLWYGGEYHEKGLNQLADYLTIHGLEKGFLIIFDDRQEKTWANQDIQHQGKEIFAVWV
ncbi:MAG: AAA family ATPase [Saprospiraceae bacterium]|nr:AAA family ATPase [Saprospiraceae bacterium]